MSARGEKHEEDTPAACRNKKGEISATPPDASEAWHQAGSASATFRAEPGATLDLAGFLVVFPTPHFLLDAASFHQFAEAANCLLNGFLVPNHQLDH